MTNWKSVRIGCAAGALALDGGGVGHGDERPRESADVQPSGGAPGRRAARGLLSRSIPATRHALDVVVVRSKANNEGALHGVHHPGSPAQGMSPNTAVIAW